MKLKNIVRNLLLGGIILLILIILGVFVAFAEFPAEFGLPLNSALRGQIVMVIIIAIILVSAIASYFTIKDGFQSPKAFQTLNNKLEAMPDRVAEQVANQLGQVIVTEFVSSLGFSRFSDLTDKELAVFKFLYTNAIAKNKELDYVFDFKDTNFEGISFEEGEIFEIIATLDRLHFLEATRDSGFQVMSIKITKYGLNAYASEFIENYEDIQDSIVNLIVNESANSSAAMSEQLDMPLLLVEHILASLEDEGYIKVADRISGMRIHYIAPDLKKKLKT